MRGRKFFHTLGVSVPLLLATLTPGVSAQSCSQSDVVAVMEQTGARLRELNADGQPRIRTKLRELGQVRGWSGSELETEGRAVLDDVQTRNLDERAAELFSTLDRLAEDETAGTACERLDQARATSKELIGVTLQRTNHALGRIDAEMRPPQQEAAAPAPAAPEPVAPMAQSPVAQSPVAPRETTAATPAVAPQPPRAKTATGAWDTQTVRSASPQPPSQAGGQPPAQPTLQPQLQTGLPTPVPVPMPDPGALGYAPEEIRAAGRGLFGNISAGLASVIDFAFQRYGKPTGYVLGDEGGGAFFAGLRYGEGRLVTKQHGERKVYWQGPSAGFDFGLAGSRVMFLVYNIDDHPELFQRFSGVDGSAYLVGGVGITFLKRGKVILAPIRTGLGLRVGANIGYLKFTPQPSLNPF